MAKVSNPLIGKTSGSVGDITFSNWKGVNVMKTKATTVANPNSPKQQAHRTAFTKLVGAYRLLVAVLSLGFIQLAIKKSQFNAFVKENLPGAFDQSNPPTSTFLPANLKISKGSISGQIIDSMVFVPGTHLIDFVWDAANLLPGQAVGDLPLMAAYNVTKNEFAGAVGTATRSIEADALTVPATWVTGDVIYGYVGFINADGTQASDSVNAITSR